jgi:hypothetical protein
MISRRDFLRLCGVTAASLALPALPATAADAFDGRALAHVRIRRAPRIDAAVVRTAPPDSVLRLYDATGDWFATSDGYVAARGVQPMQPYTRPPVYTAMPSSGPFVAEVIAPVTVLHSAPDADASVPGRVGYGAAFDVTGVQTGEDEIWYQVGGEGGAWVQALHVRPLEGEDLAPLQPHAREKTLYVDITACQLTAVADGETALTAPIAPGIKRQARGAALATAKRPAAQMMGRRGVPWAITTDNARFVLHGAYWHNAFGSPCGDGVISLAPAAALWVYRWTEPGQTHIEVS